MLILITKRIGAAVPALLGVSVISFLLLNVLPGDPLAGLVGADATQADRDALAHQLGLDRSLPVQYWLWLTGVLRGDLGVSLVRGRPVTELLAAALPNTLVLAAAAAVIGLAAGLLLGVVAARHAGRWPDRLISLQSVLGLSVPNYWLAVLLVALFAVSLHWLPAAGMHGPVGGTGDLLAHLVLPALAASAVTVGLTARTTRSSLVEVLRGEAVLNLRARGLGEGRILAHAAKNAAPPIITVAGLQVGYLLGGSVVVETIFSWPGLGQLVYEAIAQRDLRVVQGAILLVAVTFVLINLVIELLRMLVDPRLRRGADR